MASAFSSEECTMTSRVTPTTLSRTLAGCPIRTIGTCDRASVGSFSLGTDQTYSDYYHHHHHHKGISQEIDCRGSSTEIVMKKGRGREQDLESSKSLRNIVHCDVARGRRKHAIPPLHSLDNKFNDSRRLARTRWTVDDCDIRSRQRVIYR